MRFPLTEFNSNAVVTADIDLNANNLRLRYSIDVTRGLVWPEFTALERKDELWKSTCLELFLSSPDDPSYLALSTCLSPAYISHSSIPISLPHFSHISPRISQPFSV